MGDGIDKTPSISFFLFIFNQRFRLHSSIFNVTLRGNTVLYSFAPFHSSIKSSRSDYTELLLVLSLLLQLCRPIISDYSSRNIAQAPTWRDWGWAPVSSFIISQLNWPGELDLVLGTRADRHGPPGAPISFSARIRTVPLDLVFNLPSLDLVHRYVRNRTMTSCSINMCFGINLAASLQHPIR